MRAWSRFSSCAHRKSTAVCCAFNTAFALRFTRPLPRRKSNVGTWRCADVFSHAEKAALSWAEHRAGNSEQSTSDAVWSNCRKHFSEPQIAELLEYWSS